MKKLFSLLLCLALCLPVMSMAETMTEIEAEADMVTLDFGDFTMDVFAGDLYQIAAEKANQQVYALIYPKNDALFGSSDSINVVWASEDSSAAIALYSPETFAELCLASTKSQYESLGYQMTDAEVISAASEDGVTAFSTFYNLVVSIGDTTQIIPIHQMQFYCGDSAYGSYVFTFTASTAEALEAMSAYYSTIAFK